jgi:histidinol-phosphate aminotransferase
MKKPSLPGNAMDRRNWFKTSLGLAAASTFFQSLKADEVNFNRQIHPHTGRWMMDESVMTPANITARLNSNENPFAPSDKAKAAIIDGFKDANRYSRYVAQALKEKIASYENVSPGQIFLCAGLSELLNMLGSLNGLQQGEMISAYPTFDLMPAMASRLGGKWTKIALNEKFEHDLPAMENALTSNTKLMYICNPGNPCSTKLDPIELKSFVERVSKKTLVFIDEAYIDYVPEKEKNSMVSLASGKNVLVGKTLSKIHGFAGLRVAYTISSTEQVKEFEKYHTWDFSLGAPAMHGAMATLDDEGFKSYCVNKTIEIRSGTIKALENMGYKPLPSFTNFIIFPITKPGPDLVNHMANNGVALRSWNFDNKNWCRVSIGTQSEMDLFLTAMKTI